MCPGRCLRHTIFCISPYSQRRFPCWGAGTGTSPCPPRRCCTLLPYLITVYYRGIYVQTMYMSAYADIPMGLLFGAGLALYFAPEKKTPAVLTARGAGRDGVVSVAKDMGFALCLVAAAIICFDLLFVQEGASVAFRPAGGRLAQSCAGAPALCWRRWSHFSAGPQHMSA